MVESLVIPRQQHQQHVVEKGMILLEYILDEDPMSEVNTTDHATSKSSNSAYLL